MTNIKCVTYFKRMIVILRLYIKKKKNNNNKSMIQNIKIKKRGINE